MEIKTKSKPKHDKWHFVEGLLTILVRLCLIIIKQAKCLNGEAILFHYVSDLVTPTHASNSVQKPPLVDQHCLPDSNHN